MIPGFLTMLALGGLAGPPPAFHAVAFVNDPLSHGAVGDGLLSLNEAIRLHNGTLPAAQLSAAELLQVSLLPNTGSTTDVTWIELDPEVTATITIQQDLDTIVNTTYGLLLRSFGGEVVFDFSGPGITRGIHSTSSALTVEGVRVLGAPYGIDVVQADATGQPGLALVDVVVENPAQFGLRVTGTQVGGVGRVILDGCEFVGAPVGVIVDEAPTGRTTIFEARDVRVTGANDGFDLAVGGGGSARFTFDRVVVECSGTGIDLAAPSSNGRPTLVEGVHTRVRAATCARISAAADAVTWVQCSMWSLLAAPNGTALAVGALGDQVYGELNELRCVGDVAIATGGAPLPLTVRNMRCAGGAVSLSTLPSQALTIRESRFVGCATETAGTGVVALEGCSFEGGALGSASQAGLFAATGCFVANAGPGVAASQPLAQPQLGSMAVAPDDVPFGGAIQFTADLPNGLVAAFLLGTVPALPPAFPPPYHVYLNPAEFVLLPGVYFAQQSVAWTVPSQPAFYGRDLIVQAAVLPLNVAAPPLQLPPGWRFEIR